ncbi:MAG: TRAP transporter small permease [Alphaproteobacteria bacterium]
MRAALDLLYRASGALAAMLLAAICVMVLLQVGANLIDKMVGWAGGTPPGLIIPSYSEFAGFFLAATSFLALAYTLRSGGHIRVSLVIHNLPPRPRRFIELWCTAAASSMTGYFAWYAIQLVLDSLRFNDLSPGIVPVPLWIPQTPVAFGLVVLTIALIDDFVRILRGQLPTYEEDIPGVLTDSDTPPASGAD